MNNRLFSEAILIANLFFVEAQFLYAVFIAEHFKININTESTRLRYQVPNAIFCILTFGGTLVYLVESRGSVGAKKVFQYLYRFFFRIGFLAVQYGNFELLVEVGGKAGSVAVA